MKTLLTVTFVSALALSAFAQGKVTMNNLTTTLISTNTLAGGGTVGVTATNADGFYYALLTAASTVTSVDVNGQDLLTPTWTFTGGYGTNTIAPSGGRIASGTITTAAGWPLGVTNSYVIVGWASFLGHDWSGIASKLAGSRLFSNTWSGGGWPDGGFFGISPVAYGSVDSFGVSTYSLFGTVATAQGSPLTAGFTLYPVVPEPTSYALASMGGAALLIFRRKKESRR
ncbi:MAG: PEP-CTERM sorting domain-containing protein [Verrucomicrobia bacterium]|nr:MAG: PEP-CTERM sorting domain-containing protein [Verrucomicrobiota bacterium]